MTSIAMELDAKIQSVDAETAQRLERLVRDAMDLAQSGAAGGFDQLAQEEAALRARLIQQGRLFQGSDRLSREQAHSRDALR